jgi:hypothetical protein
VTANEIPYQFIVEIRADDKTWFRADETAEPMTPEEADALIAKLRAQGFHARAKFIN